MKRNVGLLCGLGILAIGLSVSTARGAERREHFDQDPAWDGHNHRASEPAQQEVVQDFGYSRTSHAGGKAGEIGGFITPTAEPSYYAVEIPTATFAKPLAASGTFVCGERPFHLLLGFFNTDSLNEWRTPNSLALRLNGRGEVYFAYLEYATRRWRAGGDGPKSFPMVQNPDTGRMEFKGFRSGEMVHRWSINYDPQANAGQGVITARMDDETAICNLSPGHKSDGATFNHFGLLNVMKSVDTGGEVWIDDVTVNGRKFDFDADPNWDALGNRKKFVTPIVRPRFDFGFSPTQFAGGQKPGELGGVIFRGDCRYPARMARYGDRLHELTLDRPLHAGGKVTLRRGVSDSGVLIGFFDSRASTLSNPAQDTGLPKSFLGISTDAPSAEGFYFAPAYRAASNSHGASSAGKPPRLYPDGASHDWTFDYSPTAAEGRGQITVTLDDQTIQLPIAAEDRAAGVRFDRFGIISTWIDGNSQTIYFDDLSYTFSQD